MTATEKLPPDKARRAAIRAFRSDTRNDRRRQWAAHCLPSARKDWRTPAQQGDLLDDGRASPRVARFRELSNTLLLSDQLALVVHTVLDSADARGAHPRTEFASPTGSDPCPPKASVRRCELSRNTDGRDSVRTYQAVKRSDLEMRTPLLPREWLGVTLLLRLEPSLQLWRFRRASVCGQIRRKRAGRTQGCHVGPCRRCREPSANRKT